MPPNCVWTNKHKAKADNELQCHIHQRNGNMPNFKFVCHQLINVFAMSLTKIFVKHDAMADCQASINAINEQKD